MNRTGLAVIIALVAGSTLSQQVINVPDDIPELNLALNPAVSGLTPGDTIELNPGLYAGSFTVTTPGITIRAVTPGTAVVDGFNVGSVFTVNAPGAPITFEGMVIRRGANPGSNGGGINVVASGGIVVRGCDFELNTANVGGAIFSITPDLTIEGSTFTDNTAALFGGALRSAGAAGIEVVITGSAFTNNRALAGNGGAVDHAGGGATLTIADSTFAGNTCTTTGGAVYSINADAVRVTGTTFSDNIALGTVSQDTGGLFVANSPDVIVRDCDFVRNLSAGSGGALRFSNSIGDVIDCRFIENEASSGGAFQVVGSGAAATVYNSVFDGNSSRRAGSDSGTGGAIIVNGGGELSVYNSLFVRNTGVTGGGIYVDQAADLTVNGSTFVANDADSLGGAIRRVDNNSSALINSSIFSGNLPTPQQLTLGTGGNARVSFSLVEGGVTAVNTTGLVDADPMFVDAANDDYSLMPGSPAIDAGTSVLYGFGPLSDLAGNDRGQDDPATPDTGEAVIGAVIDIGAFEFTPGTGVADCPADQNFDGVLSPADFSSWIINYNNGCD